MGDEILRLDKLEAARRQLREAILLFFEHRDHVAIHALAGAAHQVLVDLGERKGGIGILKNRRYIRPERHAELLGLLNEAQNFFKHADRDPDAILDFRPASTPVFLIDAVEMWGQLSGNFFKEALVYRIWYFLAHPEVIAQHEVKEFLAPWRDLLDISDFGSIRKVIDRVEFGA